MLSFKTLLSIFASSRTAPLFQIHLSVAQPLVFLIFLLFNRGFIKLTDPVRVLLREKLDLIIEDVHGAEDRLGESVYDPILSVMGFSLTIDLTGKSPGS